MDETTTSGSTSETQSESDSTTETVTQNDATSGSTTTEVSTDDFKAQIQRMEAALKKANAEAKASRLERDELRTFKERTETEKLSDTEKRDATQKKLEQQLAEYQSQNSDLLTKLQERTINSEVRLQALQMGMDPKASVKLIDYAEVLTDDDGLPTNIPELLKKLQKEYPSLLGSSQRQQTSGGATNPPRSRTSGPQEITKEYVQQVQLGGKAAWDALSDEERQRIRRFTAQGGLFKK